MKKPCALLLALALALSLAACGGGVGATDPVALGEELTAKAEGLPDMTAVSSGSGEAAGAELFRFLSDLDYAKVRGYYMAYATAGSPEEIAVIALRDPADLAEARASLERHIENRRSLFRTYDPEGEALLARARVLTTDDSAVVLVCENADELAAALR